MFSRIPFALVGVLMLLSGTLIVTACQDASSASASPADAVRTALNAYGSGSQDTLHEQFCTPGLADVFLAPEETQDFHFEDVEITEHNTSADAAQVAASGRLVFGRDAEQAQAFDWRLNLARSEDGWCIVDMQRASVDAP